ncbi:hypothetical protein Vretifemale_15, partial [Volvox reticuliferus]
IKVLQELRHPHVVRLRETFAHKETLVLVFDYAAGGDLELLLYPSNSGRDAGGAAAIARGDGGGMVRAGGVDRVGRNGGDGGGGGGVGDEEDVSRPPLPAGVVKAHMKALLEALAYCHEQGVLHRDVKPNNLLLDGQGELLLADFGLARYLPLEATGEEGEEDGKTAGLAAKAAAAASAQQTAEDDNGWRGSEPEGKGKRPAQPQLQLQPGQAAQGAEGGKRRSRGGGRGGGRSVDGGGGHCCVNAAKDVGDGITGRAVVTDLDVSDTLGGSCGDGDDGSSRSLNRWPMGRTAPRDAVGLSREDYARPVMTHQIGMRWYRPPELLFGCRTYGGGVDVWAVGCVFAEMMLRRVWFKGNSDVDQLRIIFEVLGTPTEECWPGVTRLPNYLKFSLTPPKDLATIFPDASPDALDLLAELTRLCPERRPTARQALSHPYFTSDPPPTPPGQLPLAMTRVAMVAAAHAAADAAAADRSCWDGSGGSGAPAAAGLKGGPFGGHRKEFSRTGGGGAHHAGRREHHAVLGSLPTFRAPRGQGQGHHGTGEGPLPRFQLPLAPSLPSGRLPAGCTSFHPASAAVTAGFGSGSSGVAWPVATQAPSFSHAFRLGQPSLEFPDLSSSRALPGLFPPPGSSAAGDVAAAVAAAGGSGDFPLSSGPPYRQHFTLGSRSRFQAISEEDAEGQSGAEEAWRTSSSALPYDVRVATQPAPQHRQHRGALQHWPAPAQAPLTADAAGSAPRRYRRCRRIRSSVATADMSISNISVAAVGMVGGRLCFDEVARRDAASKDNGGNCNSCGNSDSGAGLERAEEGEGQQEEDLSLVAEGIQNAADHDGAAAEAEGAEAEEGEGGFQQQEMAIDEGEEAEAEDNEEEEDDDDDEEEFDGFRRCVARRFSFGSSLATDGDVVATAAAAAAGAAAAAAAGRHGSGGTMAITTVASDGTVSTGGASRHKDNEAGDGGGGGGSFVPMATTATTAAVGGHGTASAAVTAAGYDPMSVSFSICGGGGGGGGMGTVGSKRPRPIRESSNHQTLPPTPSALAAALAGADPDLRGSAYSCFHQAQPGSNGGGGDIGGMDVRMHDRSAGSNGSIAGDGSGGGGAAVAIPTASVTAAPSFTMLSASAAASASVNAAAGGDGSGGGAAARGLMEAPPPRLRQSRTSDVTVAMSLSFAGGIDGSMAMHAPPTAIGPRQQPGRALGLEQPSVQGSHVSAVDSGERNTGRGGVSAAPLSGFPLLPQAAPRVGAAVTADVGVIAAAVAAAAATAGGGDGGFGGDASGAMAAAAAAAAPAALSDSVHLRPGPSGVRPDSTDLQYLRQRKVEVDEALRQASQADDPPTQYDSDRDQDPDPHHHDRREVQGRPRKES